MPRPDGVTTAAEFIATMQALRGWAKLTYTQLERRAHAAGDKLPRSTIATALSRKRVPRESTIASFVRACGGEEHEVQIWLAARRRIAASDETVDNLAEAVEAWLTRRARAASTQRPVVAELSQRAALTGPTMHLTQISGPLAGAAVQTGHLAADVLDFGLAEPPRADGQGAPSSRHYAAGRLAQAVAQSKGERWVGVHRRVEPGGPIRWRRLVKKLRPAGPAARPAAKP